MRRSNYDKSPKVDVPAEHASALAIGWEAIGRALSDAMAKKQPRIFAIETYPGVIEADILHPLREIVRPTLVVQTTSAMRSAAEIEQLVYPDVTDDRVFGFMTRLTLADLFEPDKIAAAKQAIREHAGPVLVIGPGATMFGHADLLVYADMARWEIQMRQRKGLISSLGCDDARRGPAHLYKRGFFVDWRLADAHKRAIWDRINSFLDTNDRATPKLAPAAAVRAGLATAAGRPFRVVPFFDPGPWGGQWMKEVCDLDHSVENFAWCFDCVPEENSLLLGFAGGATLELPAIDLVFQHPRELLGDAVYRRFGAEFPIRFDFLDTMGGGNLSLQVHPLTEYIQQRFGMPYTQDESYYLLDADSDAVVYLGFKPGVDPNEFVAALNAAQDDSNRPLDASKYINLWPAKKHDHFLIPAGTIHCSGKNSMVLEISATPYIFTFKLWDWGRLGLDGKPRPIHIEHGARNLHYTRDTQWTRNNLVNRIESIAQGDGWREERTGLHELEFIETRRHWFTGPVHHDTAGTVNVLNLVEGEEAIVESPTAAFEPFVVHYAETFILPAAVGRYFVRPHGASVGRECATMKAFVR